MASNEYIGKSDWLYICQLISVELAKYVKTVSGKELSTNDFTNDLKKKLEDIDLSLYAPLASPALTGTPTAPTAAVGTDNTQIASTAFVVAAVNEAIKGVTGISFDGPYASYDAMVAAVTDPKKGVIYLVTVAGTAHNVSDEYYWNGTAFELFGSTSVDLSGYLKTTDVAELDAGEVKAVWDSVFTA